MSAVVVGVVINRLSSGATENAKIVAPEVSGGKSRRNEYGKPKFPFSDTVVESSIGLVCPSGLQQSIELM